MSVLNSLLARVGYAYDSSQGIFYTRTDSFLQKFGYFSLYDVAAPLALMFLDCEPVRFKYDNRHWNIEFWKGRYGPFIGAEIGIYTGAKKTGFKLIDHQLAGFGKDTAVATKKDWLEMSFVLKSKGRKIFENHSDDPRTGQIEKHWWLTGFKLKPFLDRHTLVNEIKIVFKNAEMRKAFTKGLKRLGYTNSEYSWLDDDKTIQVTFSTPHSPQPDLFSLDNLPGVDDIINYLKRLVMPPSLASLGLIIAFLISAYKLAMELIIKIVVTIGFKIAAIAKYIAAKFKWAAEKIAGCFIKAGVAIVEVGKYFKNLISRENFMKLLKAGGWVVNEIGSFFKSFFKSTDDTLAAIFKRLRFPSAAIVRFYSDILKRTPDVVVTCLTGAGYAYSTISTVVGDVYGIAKSEVKAIYSKITGLF
ncbi:MAG: DUF4474 domain-containing protein [Proteobacteria bacterium]|nr:DUF4474 domain-containing protein [Pseudomonadota bacterium]